VRSPNILERIFFSETRTDLRLHNFVYREQAVVKVRIYKTIILSVVLYGCGTWSVTLREEIKLGVFENRVWKKSRAKEGWNDGRVEKTA
jgi:hypothetical protein